MDASSTVSDLDLFSDSEPEGYGDDVTVLPPTSCSDEAGSEDEEEIATPSKEALMKSAFAKRKRKGGEERQSQGHLTKSPSKRLNIARSKHHSPFKTPVSHRFDRAKLHQSAPKRLEGIREPALQSSSDSLAIEVKSALADITCLLTNVVHRVENVEAELQKQRLSVSSSSSEASAKEQVHVPRIVRSEVRRMYNDLLESEPAFSGFVFHSSLGFRDAANKAVTQKLVTQVQTQNPQFQGAQIRAAVYTYYTSLLSENRLKEKGKHNERKRARRRRERLLRKLLERRSTLKKSSMPEKDKQKWEKVLIPETMSSEESVSENEEALVVKPLTWRSERVSNFLHQLDEKIESSKGAQARRQRKERVMSNNFSSRPRPGITLPSWALISDKP